LSRNEAYRRAASDWRWPIVLRLDADPARGLPEERALYLDLHEGELRDVRAAGPDDLRRAPYVIAGDLRTWRQIVDGELEPIAALMRGKLTLVQGDVGVLATYMEAALELVKSARQVPTRFPERGAAR
ncbi:MAG: SCP2 sterol-binding domain-containing protein, partial [Clostridia bacterium]|nr:SCP2 sterol-binding domain-containing protein [Clostridia bacterium]